MRRFLARPFHKLAHRLDKIGWWIAEAPERRRKRTESDGYRYPYSGKVLWPVQWPEPIKPLHCMNCGKTMAEHGRLAECWPRSPEGQDSQEDTLRRGGCDSASPEYRQGWEDAMHQSHPPAHNERLFGAGKSTQSDGSGCATDPDG